MSTTATYATPTEIVIDNPVGRVVITGDHTATAVTVSVVAVNPDDQDAVGVAAAARIVHSGQRLTIDTRTDNPHRPSRTDVVVGTNVVFGSCTVIGAVIGGDGNTGSISGSIVTGGGALPGGVAVSPPALLVSITAPADTRMRITTVTAAVTTHGQLRRVEVDTVAGPVDIASARIIDVNTVSAPVRATVTEGGSAVIDTVTADVDIHTPGPVTVCDVRTVTGKIRRTGQTR